MNKVQALLLYSSTFASTTNAQPPQYIGPPSPNCASNQIVNYQNICQTCTNGTYPDSSGTQCVNTPPPFSYCSSNQIITSQGDCYACPSGQYADSKQERCLYLTPNKLAICESWQISSQDGRACEECAPYSRVQSLQGFQYCAPNVCQSNQTIALDGTCYTCQQGSEADATQRHCVQSIQWQQNYNPQINNLQCNQIQQISNDGQRCELCPAYTRAQNNNQFCGPDQCGSQGIVNIDGHCHDDCPGGQHRSNSGWDCVNIVAQPTSCNQQQQLSPDGLSCIYCPPFTRAKNGNAFCAADSCSSLDILSIEGRCSRCPEGSSPDANLRTCLPNQVPARPQVNAGNNQQAQCSDVQILSFDRRSCIFCPPYTKAQNNNFSCQADNCNSNQKVDIDGTCITLCNKQQQISSDGRSCINCPEYTKAQNSNSMCTAEQCDPDEIVLKSGNCSRCSQGTNPDSIQRNCVRQSPRCGDREMLSANQSSCVSCPNFTRGQRNSQMCLADGCYTNQIVLVNGKCSTCPSGSEPSKDNRSCRGLTICGPGQRLDEKQRQCVECPPYTRGQDNSAFCSSDACSGNKIINPDGTCTTCPDFTAKSTNQRFCNQVQCKGEKEILEKDGQCRQCLEYTRPDQQKRKCVAESPCNADSRVNQNGICELCPEGYQLTSDKRFCEIRAKSSKPSTPYVGRMKDISFVSISPLDRLLNQKDKDDEILVKVGCLNDNSNYKSKDYKFVINSDSVNKVTCANGKVPEADQVCKEDEQMGCGAGQPYMVELFDMSQQAVRDVSTPPSLGSYKVTKQMMECMVDNKLQIHFQFGKRQSLSGSVACFDHVDYIRTGRRDDSEVQIQDEIPVTTLNICHKNDASQKRCYTHGYQVTIMVKDSERNPPSIYPMLEPKVFAKISFNSVKTKLVILPGDQISIRFASDYTPHDGLRITPDIESADLPSPFKERYQTTTAAGAKTVELPCNDMKVADTVQCTNFIAQCTGPDDKITLAIQGAGDVFFLDQTCKDFFGEDQDWSALQNMLQDDVSKFNEVYQDADGKMKTFKISQVTLRNKFGVDITSDNEFDFSYQIGWRFQSKQATCFAGDYLKMEAPQCKLQCDSKQCLLESLKEPNAGRRMLQQAGPDVSDPSSMAGVLPLEIPSKRLNLLESNIPDRLLQIFLKNSNQQPEEDKTRTVNLVLAEVVEESVAEPINMSASFTENIGPSYEYDVLEKLNVDKKPPAFIKITKVPQHGNIVVKQFGKQIVLNEGDMVQSEVLKNFTYDQQGQSSFCSSSKLENCKDSFSYVSFGEWVGKGPQQKQKIQISPVSKESQIASGVTAYPLMSATGKTNQIQNQETDLKSSECQDQHPSGLLAGLGIMIVALMVPLVIAFDKIKQLKDQEGKTKQKASEFDMTSPQKNNVRDSQIPLGEQGESQLQINKDWFIQQEDALARPQSPVKTIKKDVSLEQTETYFTSPRIQVHEFREVQSSSNKQ